MPNIDVIHPKWSKAVLDYNHEVPVFKSLEDIIGMLSLSNIKLGIVTSKTKQELIDEFEPFGLSSYFEHTICACDTDKHKPHPEPLLACLKGLDVPVTKQFTLEILYMICNVQKCWCEICSCFVGIKYKRCF